MVVSLNNENRKDKNVKISPSILSVPIELISEKLQLVENDIDYVHIDVMDGKFVSNYTNGVEMFNVAKQTTKTPLDVHLMVENPIEEIEKYKGADIITFHVEAVNEQDILKTINKIKNLGARVGISVKPNTSISGLTKLLDKIDLVLVMTVEPGYGGQKLIVETLDKIDELRMLGYKGLIEVDGGVTIENASEIKRRDVDIIVAGTAIFAAKNQIEAINKIKSNLA